MKVVLFIMIFAMVIMAAVLIRMEAGGGFVVTVLAALLLRGIYNALFQNNS
ncbi:MAG: hypothetical protein IKJ58_04655 [Akkermansia sp.]|nr:hypothetical protein [Akkermansia sp.]